MEKSKPISMSTVSCKFSMSMSPQIEEEISYMSKVAYANTIGCLMYAMVCIRADIVHAISVVRYKFMARPRR